MKQKIAFGVLIVCCVGLIGLLTYRVMASRTSQEVLRPTTEQTSAPETSPTPTSNTLPTSYKDLIEIISPLPKSDITLNAPTTTIEVRGKARGSWFFEGTFPVELVSGTKNVGLIAKGIASADGEWMTTEYVPFHATLTVHLTNDQILNASGSDGSLILKKDNPSGDPKNDDAFIIPISLVP